jgi:hypothetical protein
VKKNITGIAFAMNNFYEINLKLNGTNSIDQVEEDAYSEFDSDSVTLKYFKERYEIMKKVLIFFRFQPKLGFFPKKLIERYFF